MDREQHVEEKRSYADRLNNARSNTDSGRRNNIDNNKGQRSPRWGDEATTDTTRRGEDEREQTRPVAPRDIESNNNNWRDNSGENRRAQQQRRHTASEVDRDNRATDWRRDNGRN